MRGKMRKFGLLIFMLTTFCAINSSNSSRCDRTPVGTSSSKAPTDGRFRLQIQSDPIRYVPGEAYNITLEAIQRNAAPNKNTFTGFFITVERDASEVYLKPPSPMTNEVDVGRFEITMPSAMKYVKDCNNLLTHTTTNAEYGVHVTWIAPGPGSGCVVFKSTVIERREIWFSDEVPLTQKLCEDDANSGDVQPIVLDKCGACDEAKYELTIERIWSKNTHPKDFPVGWSTKFRDIIGTSHTNDAQFWSYGQAASHGVATLAMHGSTDELEKELKSQDNQVRTIIKARGISHQDLSGKTYAVFRTDSEHHLISLAAMVYPSPDWFIGVSGLELCTSNGSWVERKEMNLYPFDAGVDSGPTYTSPDQATMPPEAIRRITPNQPNDIRSPFHDTESKSMKPMATLTITLQRLYEKKCDGEDEGNEGGDDDENGSESERENDDNDNNVDDDNSGKCETTEWSKWSACDMSCGGKKRRERKYKNLRGATDNWRKANCNKDLIETVDCQDNNDNCNKDDNIELDSNVRQLSRKDCTLTEFGEFSKCKSCGIGEQTRTRGYVIEKNTEECMKAFPDDNLKETKACEGDQCSGNIGEESQPAKKGKCPSMSFSKKWSKCSHEKCSKRVAVKDVTKLSNTLQNDDDVRKLAALFKKIERQKEHLDESEYEIIEIQDKSHPCSDVELMKVEYCRNSEAEECDDICNQNPPAGTCDESIAESRWYFDKNIEECGIFTYRGCSHASNNSFFTEEDCTKFCVEKETADRFESWSLVKHHDDFSGNGKIDCIVGQWKQQPCNATCSEDGLKWRYRSVVRNARNGGLPCPRTTSQVERCWKNCNDDDESVEMTSKTSSGKSIYSNNKKQQHQQPQRQTTRQPTTQKQRQQKTTNCEYTEWSAWSPCSKTCGDNAVQIRARAVVSRSNAHLCVERLEERSCDVLPCIINRFNYKKYP